MTLNDRMDTERGKVKHHSLYIPLTLILTLSTLLLDDSERPDGHGERQSQARDAIEDRQNQRRFQCHEGILYLITYLMPTVLSNRLKVFSIVSFAMTNPIANSNLNI